MKKNVAVILCGSGFKDGSEIRESVAALWALSQLPAEVHCFAPDGPQTDVVNCLTMQPMKESRNMLIEAARIARGKVKPLRELDPSKVDALLIPGGFGVAKNLCNFSTHGSKGAVIPELESIIQQLYEQKKPMGAICIAPVVLALALKDKRLELTLGGKSEAALEIQKLGHHHVETGVTDCYFDEKNRIVTTAAYMCEHAPLHELFQGIQKCVQTLLTI